MGNEYLHMHDDHLGIEASNSVPSQMRKFIACRHNCYNNYYNVSMQLIPRRARIPAWHDIVHVKVLDVWMIEKSATRLFISLQRWLFWNSLSSPFCRLQLSARMKLRNLMVSICTTIPITTVCCGWVSVFARIMIWRVHSYSDGIHNQLGRSLLLRSLCLCKHTRSKLQVTLPLFNRVINWSGYNVMSMCAIWVITCLQ